MIRITAFAGALLCLFVNFAEARPHRQATGLHPDCNITMPCIVVKPFKAEVRGPLQPQMFTRKKHKAETVNTFGNASFSMGGIVAAARREIGNGAIYGRSNLWCARFMNHILQRSGYRGTGSDMASSFARNPSVGMQVGAIAVMHRGRRGGHVGVVSGIAADGNPIIISGNHGGRVREAEYPRGRIYAFVAPL